MILIGGLGTRLRPLTDSKPKSMLPILNKAMILHILDSLPERINEIILAVSFKKEMLQEFFETEGREVILVEEEEPLGTGGAIKNVERFLNSTFLVINGDILSSLSIPEFLMFHERKGGIGAMALWMVEDPRRFGVAEIDYSERIVRFEEKPEGNVFSNLINAGIYILKLEILDYLEKGKKSSIEREVFPLILDKGLYGYHFKGYWVDCGTPESYLDAHKILLDTKFGEEIIKGENVMMSREAVAKPPCLIGNNCVIKGKIGQYTCIGSDVIVEEDCVIESSVLMARTTVRKNSIIKNSIIGEHCMIGESVRLNKCVVGDGVKIENDREFFKEKVSAV